MLLILYCDLCVCVGGWGLCKVKSVKFNFPHHPTTTSVAFLIMSFDYGSF